MIPATSSDQFPPSLTPELLAHYITRARGLRARQYRVVYRYGRLHLSLWTRRLGRRASAMQGNDVHVADALRNPLSAIRSSAEILRDTPDIPFPDRRRFAEIVLAEEARLERAIAALIEAAGRSQPRSLRRMDLGRS